MSGLSKDKYPKLLERKISPNNFIFTSRMEKKPNYSLWILWMICIGFMALRLGIPRWATNNVLAVLSWDVMGYYLYLPATFIYQDLKDLLFAQEIIDTYHNTSSFYQAHEVENGNKVMKYTMGLSLCYLPFFLLGHTAAWLFNFPMDGFSAPYQFFIGISPIVYTMIGLFLLRKVLLRYFSEWAVGLSFLLMAFGTNWIQYVVIDGAMAHSYLFFFYALIIYLTQKWHDHPNIKQALFMGFVIGWSCVIRPTELIMVLIPLFWGVHDKASFYWKVNLIKTHFSHILCIGLMMALAALPQFLYWKWITGDFIHYTYKEEGFNWLDPKFKDVLLGYKKGLFLYTPLAVIPFLGFIFLWKKAKKIFWPTFLFTLINLYIISSWSTWWYAGSFSCRAVVQSYAVLMIPLAAFFAFILKSKFGRMLSLVIIVPLVFLNGFQLWQYNEGIIHPEDMTKHYYYAIFGKSKVTQSEMMMLDTKNRIENIDNYQSEMLRLESFESIQNAEDNQGYKGTKGWKQTQEKTEGSILIPIDSMGLNQEDWLKISVRFKAPHGAFHSFLSLTTLQQKEVLLWEGVRLQHYLSKYNEWNQVWFYFPLSKAQNAQAIEVYITNNGHAQYFIDDLQVERLKPKH